MELAKGAGSERIALVAGVFEPAPDGRVYNTAVAYDAAGRFGGLRKIPFRLASGSDRV